MGDLVSLLAHLIDRCIVSVEALHRSSGRSHLMVRREGDEILVAWELPVTNEPQIERLSPRQFVLFAQAYNVGFSDGRASSKEVK